MAKVIVYFAVYLGKQKLPKAIFQKKNFAEEWIKFAVPPHKKTRIGKVEFGGGDYYEETPPYLTEEELEYHINLALKE